MANPYVFIVGCPRSGTTLLRRLVNAHPEIAITPETHWLPRMIDKRWGVSRDGMVLPDLVPRLLRHPGYQAFRLDVGELTNLADNKPLSYASFVSRVFDLYGKSQGKNVVGDKTPGYVRRMRSLHALWPWARFVHLIRDGRDVYLSIASRPLVKPKPGIFDTWQANPASTAALWWELNVRSGREAGKLLPPELYYEVRYEFLVTRPAEECTALCIFLGLPYDEAMLRFHEGHAETQRREEGKPDWRPVTANLRDWRTQMSAEDLERFEAAAGDLLTELGYTRAYPQPRPELIEKASKMREGLAHDPRTRYGAERKELSARRIHDALTVGLQDTPERKDVGPAQ